MARDRPTSPKGDGNEGFEDRVEAVIAGLPPGSIVTYGEVAEEAGFPGAARAVGGVLARSHGLPWWRVVAADGRLVPGHEDEHARRLLAEGAIVTRGKIRPPGKALVKGQRFPGDGRPSGAGTW